MAAKAIRALSMPFGYDHKSDIATADRVRTLVESGSTPWLTVERLVGEVLREDSSEGSRKGAVLKIVGVTHRELHAKLVQVARILAGTDVKVAEAVTFVLAKRDDAIGSKDTTDNWIENLPPGSVVFNGDTSFVIIDVTPRPDTMQPIWIPVVYIAAQGIRSSFSHLRDGMPEFAETIFDISLYYHEQIRGKERRGSQGKMYMTGQRCNRIPDSPRVPGSNDTYGTYAISEAAFERWKRSYSENDSRDRSRKFFDVEVKLHASRVDIHAHNMHLIWSFTYPVSLSEMRKVVEEFAVPVIGGTTANCISATSNYASSSRHADDNDEGWTLEVWADLRIKPDHLRKAAAPLKDMPKAVPRPKSSVSNFAPSGSFAGGQFAFYSYNFISETKPGNLTIFNSANVFHGTGTLAHYDDVDANVVRIGSAIMLQHRLVEAMKSVNASSALAP
eukprot:Opistho-2@78776